MSNRLHPGHWHPSLKWVVRRMRGRTRGQSLAEYSLIAVLVCLGIAAIITATGPAIGNVFSNTVYNLLGQKFTPNPTMSALDISNYATAIASITPPPPTYLTNTPLVPTCSGGVNNGKWAYTYTPYPTTSSNGLGTWKPGAGQLPFVANASCP